MIAWSDEAIEAALNATTPECHEGLQYVLIRGLYAIGFKLPASEANELARAALDAAVEAQKQSGVHDVTDYMNGMADGYEKGRAEALDEAARVAETNAERDLAYGRRYPDEYHKMEQRAHRGRTIAAAIRTLKEKQG